MNRSHLSNHALLRSLLGLLWFALATSNAEAQQTSKPSPIHGDVGVLKLGDVKWSAENNFWGDRTQACVKGTLPTMTALMFGTERSHFLQNFRIAAGDAEGKHRGPAWNDGDTYKYLEAVTAIYAKIETHDGRRSSMNRFNGLLAHREPTVTCIHRY